VSGGALFFLFPLRCLESLLGLAGSGVRVT